MTLEGKVAGLTVKGLYGEASGTIAGANIKGVGRNGKQYALSATYTSGAIATTAFYTDDSALGGTAAFCVGASYDLGGGATLAGGVARTKVADNPSVGLFGSARYDHGVNFKF